MAFSKPHIKLDRGLWLCESSQKNWLFTSTEFGYGRTPKQAYEAMLARKEHRRILMK